MNYSPGFLLAATLSQQCCGKRSGPGQLLVKYSVVCYQQRRIVAYLAYIFKALGITPARGLCGMHPGNSVLVNREPLGRTSGCIIADALTA